MSMGIPVICNSNIGDTNKIVNSDTGIIVNEFTNTAYLNTISNFDSIINLSSKDIRKNCMTMFSIESGVEKYHEVYQHLFKK